MPRLVPMVRDRIPQTLSNETGHGQELRSLQKFKIRPVRVAGGTGAQEGRAGLDRPLRNDLQEGQDRRQSEEDIKPARRVLPELFRKSHLYGQPHMNVAEYVLYCGHS
jgi:hypothetical protein